jgi:starvation-inducible DNA-binding protein
MTRPKTQQRFGDLKPMKVALSENIRKASVIDLNRALADAMVLRDLYKKHHWQVTGAMFRELHLLFDEHQAQQGELIDEMAERIMQLGGVSIAMGADAAEESEIPRPPRDREAPATQLERLLTAHEIVLSFARQAARRASEQGDDGSNDLFVSEVIRLNEKQAWFVNEHLARTEIG